MSYYDVKVICGSRVYTPSDFDYVQTPQSYPRLKINVSLEPGNICPKYLFVDPTSNLTIKNVIFNPPATIVFWSDNTKTVVKCDTTREMYDPEKGIAMAISKKMYGENKYEYYNTFLHWMKKYDKQVKQAAKDINPKNSWSGNMCEF